MLSDEKIIENSTLDQSQSNSGSGSHHHHHHSGSHSHHSHSSSHHHSSSDSHSSSHHHSSSDSHSSSHHHSSSGSHSSSHHHSSSGSHSSSHHHSSSGSHSSSHHHKHHSSHSHHGSHHSSSHHSDENINDEIDETVTKNGYVCIKDNEPAQSKKQHSGSYHSRKKTHTFRNIFIVIICFLVAISAASGAFVYSFLNKINYEDENVTLIADPEFDESIELPDEYSVYEDKAEENYGQSGIYSEENVTNILICGIDNGDIEDHLYYGRSDSMMILSINNNDNTLRLASLSRAVYVKIAGHNNSRLSAAYSYGGPALLIDTIQSNYKIWIDNYVCVNFEAFRSIINVFDGIDLYLSDEEAYELAKFIRGSGETSSFVYNGSGTYHLDGTAALLYSRIRKIDSDRARTGRQRKVLEKIFEKVKKMSANDAMAAASEVLPLITTDLSKSAIISYCTRVPIYVKWNTQQTVIPDKSSAIVEIDGLDVGVLLVNWDETIAYAKSFFYPIFYR